MSNLAELKGRVSQAVERLSDAETDRRQSNEAIARLLGDIEEKYRARNEELLYCSRRIEALSTENHELNEIIESLLGMVEAAFARGTDDPIYQASAMASELLAGWRDEATAGAAPAGSGAAPQGRFEDVTEAELAAELADELIDGGEAGDLPPPLIEASAVHHAMSFPDGPVAPTDLPAPHESAVAAGAAEAFLVEDDNPPHPGGAGPEEDEVVQVDADGGGGPGESGEHALDTALGLDDRVQEADVAAEVDIEIPEIGPADDAAAAAVAGPEDDQDPAAGIRAMMERLERVEARARVYDREARDAASG